MKQRMVFAFLVTALFALAGCGAPEEEAGRDAAPEADPHSATGSTIETAGLPVLLDLGSDSCTACKTMAPILDELELDFAGRMDVRFIDVREDRTAASEFSVKIIPTQIFFDEDGLELFRHQGFYSREDILSTWAELGYDFDTQAEAT